MANNTPTLDYYSNQYDRHSSGNLPENTYEESNEKPSFAQSFIGGASQVGAGYFNFLASKNIAVSEDEKEKQAAKKRMTLLIIGLIALTAVIYFANKKKK
jgi:hypothetical protein